MKPKYRRIQIIVISLCLICTGAFILLKNFSDNIVFFYTPSEILQKKLYNDLVRVGGLVKEGSVQQNEEFVKFTITDEENELTICYQGQLPMMFREYQGIVAKGKLQHTNIFHADELLVKHDEKYMPKELVTSIKNSGTWRE